MVLQGHACGVPKFTQGKVKPVRPVPRPRRLPTSQSSTTTSFICFWGHPFPLTEGQVAPGSFIFRFSEVDATAQKRDLARLRGRGGQALCPL